MAEENVRGLMSWLLLPGRTRAATPDPTTGPAHTDAAEPQQALPTRFLDEGEIGKGGMSSVRRVYDVNLLRHVAMKVLDPRLAREPRESLRFREEAQITGQLEHPHIPPVYELGQDADGTNYFTMRLVRGRTLLDVLREPSFSPANEASLFRFLEVFTKVAQAVSYAHMRGVLHLDIKPTNVMVGDHGQVHLMDWGIARLTHATRQSGNDADRVVLRRRTDPGDDPNRVLGTLAYMSPEQARGQHDRLDERTDVYMLGALLYRALAGRAPHEGTSAEETLLKAEEGRVPHPGVVCPEVALPMHLCDIAMRALAPEPSARYPTAAALLKDVESFQRGDGRFEQRHYEAGAPVIREGDEAHEAFVITAGRCIVSRMTDGNETLIRTMGPGEVFGEAAVFTNSGRTASVRAITPLTVTVVTRASLEREIGQTAWMGRFVHALADRFNDVTSRVGELNRRIDHLKFEQEVLRLLARRAETLADGSRGTPWLPLCRELGRRHRLTSEEVATQVGHITGIRVDVAGDVVRFIDTDALDGGLGMV